MIRIDKETIYESHGYTFRNVVTLNHAEKLKILMWRNSKQVRSVMVNKGIISEHDHLVFIEGLNNREDCYYWLVANRDGEDVGVLDLLHVDENKDVGELGYYMDPSFVGMGLEFVLECEFFVYHVLQLGNNVATVSVNNKAALLLNTYLGDTYEGVEEIDGESYFFNKHANGHYLIQHYQEFNLNDYFAYWKAHKDIVKEIIESITASK